ncbi:MAG: hypothetical protein ACJ72S_07075, partial [Nitrososphaeraceae archaeon]
NNGSTRLYKISYQRITRLLQISYSSSIMPDFRISHIRQMLVSVNTGNTGGIRTVYMTISSLGSRNFLESSI